MLVPWKKSYDKPRQHIKKQRHYFDNKSLYSQSYGFSSSHVWMWELDYTESWVPKNWCFWTVVLEKTLESGLDCKEIQPVIPKGNQSWIFIGRTDAETETLMLWHLIRRIDSLEKTLMLGKIEGRRRRGWQRMSWLDELASLTQWTWVWTNSRSWWWTGRPGVLQSVGSQRVGHNWATGLNSIFGCLLTVSYLILPSAPYILKLGKLIRKPKFFPLVLVGDSNHVSPYCVGEPSPQPHACK